MVIIVSAGGKVAHRGRARIGSREKEHSAKVAFFSPVSGIDPEADGRW